MICEICGTDHTFTSRHAEGKASRAHGGWPVGTTINAITSGRNYRSWVILPICSGCGR